MQLYLIPVTLRYALVWVKFFRKITGRIVAFLALKKVWIYD